MKLYIKKKTELEWLECPPFKGKVLVQAQVFSNITIYFKPLFYYKITLTYCKLKSKDKVKIFLYFKLNQTTVGVDMH